MSVRRFVRTTFATAFLFAVTTVVGVPLQAQQTGAVTGEVTSTAGEPLESAQVVVAGTGLGTLTDADGAFRITDVPTGQQTVRVRLIGYAVKSRPVQVTAGQATTVRFELNRKAVELGQIVVTGTGTGGVEQKRLGNSTATISTDQVENAATINTSEMMAARESGIQILPSSGLAGEGSTVRVRGNSSLTQSNEPIIYIDGVRMNRGGQFTTLGGGFFAGTGGAGTGATSRLDDIDPNSIERIEILKGAAAATLYGTEASNGVIQIFTKSGREGRTRWSVEAEQGLEFMPEDRLVRHGDFWAHPHPTGPDIATRERNFKEYWGFNTGPYEVVQECILCDFDQTGRVNNVSVSVNGGSEGLTYFASGRWQNLDGIYGPNNLGRTQSDGIVGNVNDLSERVTSTLSLNLFPSDEVRVQSRFNYAFNDQRAPQTTNNIFGVWSLGYMSRMSKANEQNPTGAPIFATVREVAQWTTDSEIDHFGGSVNLDVRPSQELTLHATGGVDVVASRSQTLAPFGWPVDNFSPFLVKGFKEVANDNNTQITAELRAGWEKDLFGGDISSSLTVGGQGFLTERLARGSSGSDFPGPGVSVVGSTVDQSAFETFTQNVNVGVFAQEQIGYKDWAFVTLGARLDANSAFGEEFNAVLYPKVNGSLVLSDMPGWDSETLSTLRLRGAVGESGLQPGAFDKFRTFSSAPSAEGAGLQPDNLGQPELAPEVTTEYEAGLEIGLFNDRVGFDGTWWTRTTNDALVSRQFPVTGGFLQNQLDNIGTLDGHGFDLEVNGQVVQSEDLSVNLFAHGSFLHENVTDMGGAPPIKAGGSYPRYRNFIKEDFAPGAFLGAKPADVAIPLQASLTACEPFSRQEALEFFSQPRTPDDFEVFPEDCSGNHLDQFLGKPTPDWSGSFGADVSFLGRFQLHSLFEYKAGNFFAQDLSGGFRQSNAVIGRNTPLAAEVISTMMNPASSPEERLNAAVTWATELRALAPMSGMNMVHPADFLRWRELSLTYNAPGSLARTFSLRSLTFSLRARNLELWVNSKYTGLSPELNINARCAEGTRDCNWIRSTEGWRMPLPRRLSLSVRAGF